jgi:hypothetical protein
MSLSQTSRTNRERWRRVEQIYVEAVERDGDARATLLEHACGNDAALRQDVESLLACQAVPLNSSKDRRSTSRPRC